MTIIKVKGFHGENRAVHPAELLPTLGVTSLNQKPGRGDLRPWKAPLEVATVGAGRKTIYRFGRDVPSDTDYWLTWTTDVSVVRGFNEADNGERTYYSGDGAPKWTDTSMALASLPYPTSSFELGLPAPVSACLLSASGGVSTVMETRAYTYTYASGIGQESAPAPASLLLHCKIDDTVAISGMSAPPAGNYGITLINIYRTQGTTSDYYYLRNIASTGSSSSDENQTLGRVLETIDWLTPPADLKGLIGLWNGMMAGISGRSVRFCEPFVPHAWPLAYEILPPHTTPVALGAFGQSLVILTNGVPIIASGGAPAAMDEQPLEFAQACVAATSVVSMGHGVVWSSPDGLCYVGEGGAKILTDGMMTRDDWQALVPATIIGTMYERRYLGFYTVAGVTKGFLLDPLNPTGLYFFDFGASAVYLDDLQDALYVLDGTKIKKWDAGDALNVTFRSKLFRQPEPIPAFALAQVMADSYPLTFNLDATEIPAAEVTKLLIANGHLSAPIPTSVRYTVTVTDRQPFRLPDGFHAQSFQLEVVSAYPVQSIALAHDYAELAAS